VPVQMSMAKCVPVASHDPYSSYKYLYLKKFWISRNNHPVNQRVTFCKEWKMFNCVISSQTNRQATNTQTLK